MAKKSYKKSNSMGGMLTTVLGAMAYGAIREKASNALAPLTANIPMGNISDEIALGGLAVLLDRTVGRKIPFAKPLLKGALIVESARVGEAIINGQVGLGGNSSTTDSNVYG